MLGGGTFTTMNKAIPGSYINMVSAANASYMVGERGVAALAMQLSWGADDAIFEVSAADFKANSLKLFGFEYASDEAKGLRDLFRSIKTLYAYKLMKNGVKAANGIASAKWKGAKGNQISTEVLTGTTDGTFDVNIYFGTRLVWSETVSTAEELKSKNNGFVDFTIDVIEATERTLLNGGDDGEEVTSAEHTAFLNASESYRFNAIGCLDITEPVKNLYVQECKDMRDGNGVKYQLVGHNIAADYEGVVNVKNSVDAVWWVLGVIAGCEVNSSNTNKLYDGEFTIPAEYTQAELEKAIKAGEFTFHRVGSDIRVLTDINSLVTTTEAKGDDFKSNQTVRVVDQIAMDIASIFAKKYIGQIPNDESGRDSLWNDIVNHHQKLEAIRAIEEFDPDDVVVEAGNDKRSVVVTDTISVVNAMEKLYVTIIVA